MQLIYINFYFSGFQFRVHHVIRSGADLASDRDDKISTNGLGVLVRQLVDLRIQHHLGHAILIPQVHENESPVIAPGMHPSAQGHRFANVAVR